ncbi:hypothetical protein MKEN_01015300 [Mycena kentingensis (nom. inval.)]|nr:hypothetical protein MKEN_01015300 [Mycena kentingensis (nom. inval.)]
MLSSRLTNQVFPHASHPEFGYVPTHNSPTKRVHVYILRLHARIRDPRCPKLKLMDTEDHYIYTDATIEEVKAEINGLIRFIEAQEAQGVNSQLYVQYRARFKKYLGRLRTYHRGWADIQTWIGTSVFKPRNTINRDIDLILRDYMRASAVARADRAAAEAAAARAAEAAAREAEAAAQEAEEAERRRHRRSESIPIPAPRGNVNRSRAPEPLITLSGVQFASSASSGDIFPYEPDQRRPSYEHRSEALMRQGPAAVAQHNARMREQARASAERRAQVAAQQQEEAVRALEVLERDQAARWARQAALGRGGGYGGNAYGHPQSYNVLRRYNPPPSEVGMESKVNNTRML